MGYSHTKRCICWLLVNSMGLAGLPLSTHAETVPLESGTTAIQDIPSVASKEAQLELTAEATKAAMQEVLSVIRDKITPAEAKTLNQNLKALLERSLYFGVPGITEKPTEDEIKNAEATLTILKSKVTKVLRQSFRGEKQLVGTTLGSVQPELVLISDYFNLVSRILEIKILNHHNESSEYSIFSDWINNYSLSISNKELGNQMALESLSTTTTSYDSDKFSFKVELSPGLKGALHISLKDGFIENFLEKRLAQQSSLEGLAYTASFISATMLVENFNRIELYLNGDFNYAPIIYRNTLKAFPSLKFKVQQIQADKQWLISQDYLSKVKENYEKLLEVFGKSPSQGQFVNTEFTLGISRITFEDGDWLSEYDEGVIEEVSRFQQAEEAQTLETFERLLKITPFPEEATPNQISEILVSTWVQAKSTIFKNYLLVDGDSEILSRGSNFKKIDLKIESRQRELYSQLMASNVPSSLEQFIPFSPQKRVKKIGQEFFEKLLADSAQIKNVLGSADFPVNPQLLGKALKLKIDKKEMSFELQKIFPQIFNADSYATAATNYLNILSQMGKENFAQGEGLVSTEILAKKSPREINDIIKDWKWKSTHSPAVSKIGAKSAERSKNRRIKDYGDFITLGQWFGFFNPVSDKEVLLKDLNLENSVLESYQKELKDNVFTLFPILSLKISDKKNSQMLWQLLNGNSSDSQKKEVLSKLLVQTQSNIRRSLGLIEGKLSPDSATWRVVKRVVPEHFNSSDNKKFMTMVSDSMGMAFRLQSHPIYKELYGDLTTELSKETLGGQLWRTFYHNYVEMGFMLLIGYHVLQFASKFVSPWFSSAMKAAEIGVLGPYLSTFMVTSMGFLVIDLAEGGYSLNQKSKSHDLMKTYFNSSAQGIGFFKYSDVVKSDHEYQEAKSEYYTEAGGLLAFVLGLPILLRVVPKFHTALKMYRAKKRLITKLHRLGFQNKNYSFFESDLQAMYSAALKQVKSGPYPSLFAHRLKAEYQEVLAFVNNEARYWQKLGLRNQHQFKALGLEVGEWAPTKMDRLFAHYQVRLAEGSITKDQFTVIDHSYKALKKVMMPELRLMAKDPFADALYQRIWNVRGGAVSDALAAERFAGEFNPEKSLNPYHQNQTRYEFKKQVVKIEVNGEARSVEFYSPERMDKYSYDQKWKKDIEDLTEIFGYKADKPETRKLLEWLR